MENKKGLNFFFVIIAIISGVKIFEKFDAEILNFDEPLQSIIYIIYVFGFIASICGLIMNYKNLFKKQKPLDGMCTFSTTQDDFLTTSDDFGLTVFRWWTLHRKKKTLPPTQYLLYGWLTEVIELLECYLASVRADSFLILITTLLKFEQILLIYVKPVHQNDSKDEIC